MIKIWRNLFQRLSEINSPIIAYWKMSNGAEFWLAIPKKDSVLENTFAKHVQFPFAFDEIVSLRIQRSFGERPAGIENDFDTICKYLGDIQGLNVDKSEDKITLSIASNTSIEE